MNHSFFGDCKEYKLQWYRCSGICTNYNPFKGIYRSVSGCPSTQNDFFDDHSEYCGGHFFKCFEMTRNVAGITERQYVINTRYSDPKPIISTKHTSIKPREIIDLSDDTDVNVVTPCVEIIDLNDTVLDEDVAVPSSAIADAFINKFNAKFQLNAYLDTASSQRKIILTCPICDLPVVQHKIILHFDACKGKIEKVAHKRSAEIGTSLRSGLKRWCNE